MPLPLRLLGPFALSLAALMDLAGCGFHLRGSGGDTSFEQRLYIEGPGTAGTFLGVFGNALTGAGGSMVKTPVESTGVVHLYRAIYSRQPITLSRIGLATGYDLSYRIVYDLRSPKGEVLQPRREFEVKRDYFNDQTLPLAQLAEEGLIREEVEKEAAQSLLRQVVAELKRASEASLSPDKKP